MNFRSASAGDFSEFVERIAFFGKTAVREMNRAATISAARKFSNRAAALTVNDADVLELTKWASGAAVSTVAILHGDDILRLLDDAIRSVFISEEVLNEHADQLTNNFKVWNKRN